MQEEPSIPSLIEDNQPINHLQFIPPPQESPTFPIETTITSSHPPLRTTPLLSSPPILINHDMQPRTNNIPSLVPLQPTPSPLQAPQRNVQTLPSSPEEHETLDITYDKIEYNAEIFHTPQGPKLTQSIRIEEQTPDSGPSTQKTIKKHFLKRKAQALDRWLEVKSSMKKSRSKPPHSRKSSSERRSDFGDSTSQRSERSRSPSQNRNSKEGLVDWINRRVTGYMIFQNSVDKDLKDIKMDDIDLDHTKHMNSLVGKKWKSLTPTAREEYKSIAMQTRVDFKKELDRMENVEDFKDIYSDFITRIKKIKKD